jgi:hypothetical protein
MNAAKNDRVWMAGGGVSAVVIAALAWFAVVSPELSNAASLDEQTLAAQTQNITLQTKLNRLRADNANLDALKASLNQARAALPVDTEVADFTRQLSRYASDSGVSVSGITAGEPASVSASTSGSAAPAAGAAVTPAGKTFGLPLTVVVKGTAANDLRFLQAVQGPNRRAVLVSATQLTGDTTKRGAAMQLTIQLQLFVAPQAPGSDEALATPAAGTSK